MLTKCCSACGQEKPLTDYTPSKDGRLGRVAECRICRVGRTKKWYADNREAQRAVKRQRYDPEKARLARLRRRQRDRERLREWRERNLERSRGYTRKARHLHPERYQGYRRKAYYEGGEREKSRLRTQRRRAERPEEHRLETAKRRAVKRQSGGKVLRRDAVRLLLRYRGVCAYCPRPADTLDHVIPLVRGGRHTIGNLVPACRSCNSSKNARLLVEWRHRRA